MLDGQINDCQSLKCSSTSSEAKAQVQTVLSTPFQTVSVLLDLHDVNESTCPYMVISDTQVVSTETFYLQEAANQNNV